MRPMCIVVGEDLSFANYSLRVMWVSLCVFINSQHLASLSIETCLFVVCEIVAISPRIGSR